MINVHNKSSKRLKVAINRWGTNGNTDFCIIDKDNDDNWDREDDRGFVMIVIKEGENGIPYYVHANSDITVTDSCVTDIGPHEKYPIS